MTTLICLYLLAGLVFVAAICVFAGLTEGWKTTLEGTDWLFALCNIFLWPITMLMWYEELAPMSYVHANLSRAYNTTKAWVLSLFNKEN